MHKCTACSREIRNPEAPIIRDAPRTPEAYAMNMLDRDRYDDLRRNTVRQAPVPSELCYDCWAKTPEGIAWEQAKFGSSKATPAPAPSAPSAPDYTKVGGWLMAFGILAGLTFPLGLLSALVGYRKQTEILQRLPAWAAGIHAVAVLVGLLLIFVALAQCVCIFQRRRLGRTLSVIHYGTALALALIKLPLLGPLSEAASPVADGPIATAISVGIAIGWLAGLILNGLCLAYFLKSERVAKTLVN